MQDEPHIVINGVTLLDMQAATVRVAVADFLASLQEPGRMEALGAIGPLYEKRAVEVQSIMLVSPADRAMIPSPG